MAVSEPSVDEPDLATEKHSTPLLEYTRLGLQRVPLPLSRLLIPYVVGALLPFLAIGFVAQEPWWWSLGLFVSWGECGALLLVIKIRSALVSGSIRLRNWPLVMAGGISNTLALGGLVALTTARNQFSPLLGDPGRSRSPSFSQG